MSKEKYTLFEMTGDWLEVYGMADDPDTDPEVWFDTMETIEGEIEIKAEGYCKLIKNLAASVEADKARVKSYEDTLKTMKDHIKAKENNIDRIKRTLAASMLVTGKTKIPTDLFKISARETESLSYAPDLRIGDIPDEFINEQKLYERPVKNNESYLNTAKIKEMLANGVSLPFATLEKKPSLTIR